MILNKEITQFNKQIVGSDDSEQRAVLIPRTSEELSSLIEGFGKYRYLKFHDLFKSEVFKSLYNESLRLFDMHSKRKDFVMEETDFTLRKISTVSGNVINKESEVLVQLYKNKELISFLEKLSGTELFITPDLADRHTIHRLHQKGDEHGGHLDTYPFVLIFCLEHPDVNEGGELVFVPNSIDVTDLKTEKAIRDTFKSGECYFMKADVNVHCVLPLKKDVNRTVLVFTYADSTSKDIVISYSSNKLYD